MRMISWFQEDVLRRVLRNTGKLGVGKAIGAIIHLASLALTARWLGPSEFGLLILARSYSQAASGLAKFQSWQTLIRYGAVPAEQHQVARFRNLAAFTLILDGATGLIGGLIAAALVPILAGWLGMTADSVWLAQLYCLVIPLMTSATPNGVLRIFDRFDRLSWQSVLTPTIRLMGLGIAGLAGAPLWACVVAWLVSDIIGETFLWIMAAVEMRRQRFSPGPRLSPREAMREHPGILRFAFATNFTATLNQSMTPMFTLAVGGLLGTASAGVFRVAQVILDAIASPAELAMRSLFPEATRLLDRDPEHFWRLIRRVALLCIGLGLSLSLIVFALGPLGIAAAMGKDFANAGTVLQIVALAFAAILMTNVFETALLAIGMAGRVLGVRAVAAGASFATLFILAPEIGLSGASIALVIPAFITAGGMLYLLMSQRSRASA
jgi:O-antigen/teichoic acid export membrane protein